MSIDLNLFRSLYRQGVPRKEIADQCGISISYVSVLSRKLGLGQLGSGGKSDTASKSAKGQKRDGQASGVLATGGRYRALAEFAEREGITMIKAQQIWHRARRENRNV